jgi:trehalose-6-phosphatase
VLASSISASKGSDFEYFSAFRWCLSPALTVRRQRAATQQTLDSLQSVTNPWQQEEAWINLYLLLCGLHCTASDYLAYRPWTSTRRDSPLRALVASALDVLGWFYRLSAAKDQMRVLAWTRLLEPCIDSVCHLLLDRAAGHAVSTEPIDEVLRQILEDPLPESVLDWRLRIPEAFRCQDLTHHDVIVLAQRCAESLKAQPHRPVFVLGPRTAGSYFAPITHACLRRHKLNSLGWLTVRPKEGLTRAEHRTIVALGRSEARLVIVDDHPNTGETFKLLLTLLQRLGVSSNNITILAPEHPAQANWSDVIKPLSAITVEPTEFYKYRLLHNDARLLECIRSMLQLRHDANVQVDASASFDHINDALAAKYGDGFQVRLKRVFGIEYSVAGSGTMRSTVVAKSVGWGWFGYHAAIAAAELQGYVPEFLGLRDGLMFLHWIGGDRWPPVSPESTTVARLVPSYLARRIVALNLEEDPTIAKGYRRTGRERIADALSLSLGPIRRRLMRSSLRRRVAHYASKVPTLVDGRMRMADWILGPDGARKVDFEHHNFGGGEQDLVDPAYDLAAAIYELALDAEAEGQLVADYRERSGDMNIQGRLLLYKYFVGRLAMEKAANVLRRESVRHLHAEMNHRFLSARNFLTFQLNRHHAGRVDITRPRAWSDCLFIMDLDGVFDIQRLGFFPHTTTTGLLALRKLQMSGYSVVPNSGRSIEHVLDYCRNYGFPGGIAEYGCILADCVGGRTTLVYGDEQRAQLERCRAELENLPGVYCDPGYRGLIRAYRYQQGRWRGLSSEEIQQVLRLVPEDAIVTIRSDADTCFLPNGINKATGLKALLSLLALPRSFVAAIGNAIQDREMLEQADAAFIPANGSVSLQKALRSSAHVRLTRGRYQRGLLEAVNRLLKRPGVAQSGTAESRAAMSGPLVHPGEHIIDWVLDQSDRYGSRD